MGLATYVSRVLLVLGVVLPGFKGQSAPNFCSYTSDYMFECDYSSMVTGSDRPIDYSQFSPVPQRLQVQVNGFMPYFGDTQVFSSGFAGINTNSFDNNYAASLTLDCGHSGSMYISAGGLANMSHIQHFKITNCKTYLIPASAFQELENLDYFGFYNGYIDSVDPNAMAGLNVERLTTDPHTIPRNQGHFELMYTRFTGQMIPPGLLYSWKNLTKVTMRGSDINSITSDVFRYNTKLRIIDLSDNGFSNMPSDIFNVHESLAEVHVYNIPWDCSCDNAWFVPYSVANNITFFGDLLCTNQTGVTVAAYYYSNCVTTTTCGDVTGVAMGAYCVTPWAIIILILSVAALVAMIVSLVLVILMRKSMQVQEKRRVKAIGRWNKIIDSSIAKNKFNASNAAKLPKK